MPVKGKARNKWVNMLHFNKRQGLSRTQMRHLFRFVIRRLHEERLPQVAGSLTFTTVLSLVPILTVALAIFSAFPLFATFRASLEAYMVEGMMPSGVSKTISSYLNQFASKSASLSAVGGLALVVTSVMTIATIEQAFNQIWRVKNPRPLMSRILIYWAIITLGPVLIGGSISLMSYLSALLNVPVDGVPLLTSLLSFVLSVFMGSVAFATLYVLVPNQRVEWRDAFLGGVFAALVIEIAKRLFTAYVMKIPTYTVVYGALAVLPIFLLWVYMMWMLTLLGAVVTSVLPTIRYERWWHDSPAGSDFLDALVVLKMLHHARSQEELATVEAVMLRTRTRLGYDELQALMQRMADAGWVGMVEDEVTTIGRKRQSSDRQRWVLLANPEQLKLLDVHRMFMFSSALRKNDNYAEISALIASIEKILDKSLSDYFSGVENL